MTWERLDDRTRGRGLVQLRSDATSDAMNSTAALVLFVGGDSTVSTLHENPSAAQSSSLVRADAKSPQVKLR